MTIVSTTVGKNPLEEMEYPSWSTTVWNAVLGCNLKNDRIISVHFQGKPFNTTVIQVYVLTRSWMVLWRLTRPSRTNTQKRCLFHHGLECKSRKSGNTWSNREIWPWNTEWNRAKANRVLPRECTGHNKHPLPTTQESVCYDQCVLLAKVC